MTKTGTGKQTILFLHGLWGGGNYFRKFDFLDKEKFTSLYPDELGFGRSPKPDLTYSPEVHCKAIEQIIPKNKKVTVIAHSFGAVLATYFAQMYPEKVNQLILISPIVYKTQKETEKYLSKVFITKLTIEKPLIAKAICKTLCSTHALGVFSPFFVSKKKKIYVGGCTEHTWHSYYSSLSECVLKKPTFPVFENVSKNFPTTIIYGPNDSYVDTPTIQTLSKSKQIEIQKGRHDVLFEKFEEVTEIIKKEL